MKSKIGALSSSANMPIGKSALFSLQSWHDAENFPDF